MMVPRLPLEILNIIVQELDDAQDLRHVRMACHALCTVATPNVFRTISVIASKGSARNFRQVLDLPDIAVHVREVSYHDTGVDKNGRALNYSESSLSSSHEWYHKLTFVYLRLRVS